MGSNERKIETLEIINSNAIYCLKNTYKASITKHFYFFFASLSAINYPLTTNC